jgi:hypothetical protein
MAHPLHWKNLPVSLEKRVLAQKYATTVPFSEIRQLFPI